MALVHQCESTCLRNGAPLLTAPNTTKAFETPVPSSDDDDDEGNYHNSSMGRPPLTPMRKMNPEEVFLKNMVGLLNKRGYNVRESAIETSTASSSASCTRSSSITSTGSALSSVLLALREPNHGQTPLHIAVRKGDMQVLEALFEHESMDELLNVLDNNENTALHFATGNWRHPMCVSITEMLIDAGANVHTINKRGLTPLAVHLLTLTMDNPTLVNKLLEAGADPDSELEGVTLLHVAARRNLPMIAGVLVSYGATMQSLNTDGLMCYEVASSRVQQSMVRHITHMPAFVPATQRRTCMRCKSPTLVPMKRTIRNRMKKVFGLHVRAHECNCYHCGMLFCAQCLKPSVASSAISFLRADDDSRDKIRTCRLCEAVLVERKRAQASQHTFDMHRMGFRTAA
ncbi:hypothetical protein CCR75_006126 [Bremia lactucae]|uniref:Myosin-like protein n=1 Tax=Bremia lactucae TaxID=4779 RepID=A0A976NZB9_BRELC|nr:hypothetical protein CCR75_006126 [Bremia lactucae]